VQAHIKRIKTVINHCRNVLDLPIDRSYKEFSMKYIEPDIVFLLPHEIDLLRKVQFKDNEQDLEQVRDFFLFGCYVGARYADLVSFTSANILQAGEGKVSLQYRPKKTPNVTVNVSLITPAWKILEKYAGSKKLLPAFRNDEINALIKVVAERAGINAKINRTTFGKKRSTETYFKYQRLTMHCSRHTFATICFMRGMEEITVQNFLGHTNVSRTKRYIHLAEGFKAEAMEKIWDWTQD
jgi:site-specific recombinase XerD